LEGKVSPATSEKEFVKKLIFLTSFLLLALAVNAEFFSSTNISDVYAHLNFNPSATNCGTLVQVSDIHMCLNPLQLYTGVIVTNLDGRLVKMINEITPQPTAMIVTGDLSISGATAFGDHAYQPEASNELVYARIALSRYTNFPLYIIPGNHDNPANEVTNSPTFNEVFTNWPRYTNFTVAGMPVVALAGHGGGWLDPEEVAWLGRKREELDHTKSVIFAVHQPVLPGLVSDSRETKRQVTWFFRPWKAPVYTMAGHAHMRAADEFLFGSTTLTEYICPAAQNGLVPTSNPLSPFACGFNVWCITNGRLAGVITGVLTNQTYYFWDVNKRGTTIPYLYDGTTNIVFRAEEGHFDRAAYEMKYKGGADVTYWRSYVSTYTCRLPISKFTNATHAFFICDQTNATTFYLGHSTNSWGPVPILSYNNGVVAALIPPELRSDPLYFSVSNTTYQMFIGGFGLLTTNNLSDYEAWAGANLGDATISPQTVLPGGNLTAGDAYLFGLDPDHPSTDKNVQGYPAMGGWPYINRDLLRFSGKTNMQYSVWRSDALGGPWTKTTNKVTTLTTNGWSQYEITNKGPASFYRVSSP
jgi:3',5'-cyclic AMP phosphodiesterase CpdA